MRLGTFMLLASLLSGCGYTSEYSPPRDGRVRAVWREDRVTMVTAGAPLSQECGAAMQDMVGTNEPLATLAPPPPGYYQPRWYGPSLVMLQPGIAPPILRPPLFFSPSAMLAAEAWSKPGGPGRVGIGGGGGGGGGSMKGLEKAAVYLAVVALLVMPVIDVAVALAPAEKAEESARAIEEVNAFNDLLRWPGSPCAVDGNGAPAASPVAP